jgi:hypothetical protein
VEDKLPLCIENRCASSLSSAHLSPCFQPSVAGEKREKPNDERMCAKKKTNFQQLCWSWTVKKLPSTRFPVHSSAKMIFICAFWETCLIIEPVGEFCIEGFFIFVTDAFYFWTVLDPLSGDGQCALKSASGPVVQRVIHALWSTFFLLFLDASFPYWRAGGSFSRSKYLVLFCRG